MDNNQLNSLVASDLNEVERAVVLLWFEQHEGKLSGSDPSALADQLESAGAAKINRSRLRTRLQNDPRVVKASNGAFKLNPRRIQEARSIAEPLLGPARPTVAQGFIDAGIFENARGYVKNVVEQINVSYANDCQDCAAVMIRRLFETLLVDAFEKQNRLQEITDNNGNIFQLSGLIGALEKTQAFAVSRQTKQASSHLKDIGDWSAHNRRHRARKSDVDAVAKHLRIACSDLLHLAGQD
jgi:hypothetical protein